MGLKGLFGKILFTVLIFQKYIIRGLTTGAIK